MLSRSTLQLLRFHFSFFLLPVYLFAVSQVSAVDWLSASLVFFILHVLVYPASNGYNSYMDRDETPIGGLSSPLQPTQELFWVTVAMDVSALFLSLVVSGFFAVGIFLYILASRAYSYRGIRLKQYPIIGFLTVFIFQGVWIFFFTYIAVGGNLPQGWPVQGIIASFLIGALYPLTQIFQHEADRADGVQTISMLLGKRGSFVFSTVLFVLAAAGIYLLFANRGEERQFLLFLIFTFPVVLFFLWWMLRVWQNEQAANFTNSLRMNILATVCTTAYFLTINILKH